MKDYYKVKDLNPEAGQEGKNRFKFKSFSDRVADIDVDVYHKIGRTQLEPDGDADSFFNQALREWGELNLTAHMARFSREVIPYISSLPQILFHKATIAEILLRHLNVKDSMALQPLLNLSCLLARDLQEEFYEYFQKFFETFISLLDLSDPDLIEEIFQTMSYLLKFLQKILVQHITDVYKYYAPLLQHPKAYIRTFAAQSFAFLVRKLDKDGLRHFIQLLLTLEATPSEQLIDGISVLFVELVKGVKNRFHSKATMTIDIIFEFLNKMEDSSEKIEKRYEIFSNAFKSMNKHTNKEFCGDIWNPLVQQCMRLLQNAESGVTEIKVAQICGSLEILENWITFKDGAHIPNTQQPWKITETIFNISSIQESILRKGISLLFTMQQLSTPQERNARVPQILDKIFLLTNYPKIVYEYCRDIIESDLHSSSFLEKMNKFVCITLQTHLEENLSFISDLRSNIVIQKKLPRLNLTGFDFLKFFSSSIEEFKRSKEIKQSALLWKLLMTVDCIQVSLDSTSKPLNDLLNHLLSLNSQEDPILTILAQTIQSIVQLHLSSTPKILLEYKDRFLGLLKTHGSHPQIVDSISVFNDHLEALIGSVDSLKPALKEALSSSQLAELISALKHNLYSPIELLRIGTLEVLTKFEQPPYLHAEANQPSKPCKTLHQLLNLEKIPKNALQGPEISVRVKDVEVSIANKSIPNEIAEAIPYHLLGILYMKFSTVWGTAAAVSGTFANQYFKLFWNAFSSKFDQVIKNEHEPEEKRVEIVTSNEIESQFMSKVKESRDTSNASDTRSYFLQLLKVLCTIPRLVEQHSRDIVPYFLDFVHKEYDVVFQDINNKEIVEQRPRRFGRKVLNERLCGYLELFSKFTHSDKIFKSSELKEILMRLITKPDPKIQSLALSSLVGYKINFITAHKESLQRLIGDKTFREELTLFTEEINEEYRSNLIDLVSRILYGKLTKRKGKGGQNSLAVRRNTIVAFFARFRNSELKYLVDLLTYPFSQILDNYHKTHVMNSDIYFPPNAKQVGFLKMAQTLFKQLGTKLEPFLEDIIAIIVHLLHAAVTEKTKKIANEESDDDEEGADNEKETSDIRDLCFSRLSTIWESFPNFPNYEPHLVDMFFAAIKPITHRSIENALNLYPKGLLNCCIVMSKHFQLVGWLTRDTKILHNIIELLLSSDPSVVGETLTVVENILAIKISQDENVNKDTKIDLLVTPDSVNRILCNLHESVKRLDRIDSHFAKRELSVISKISIFATDADQAAKLLELFQPHLRDKRVKEDAKKEMLGTFRNLLRLANSPTKYIPFLAVLFGHVTKRETRLNLCGIFQEMAKVSPEVADVAEAVTDLNAYSTQRLDEYNFDARMKAYGKINESLCKTLSGPHLLPIVYNYLYYMNDLDLSIRSSSSYGLLQIVKNGSIGERMKDVKGIIMDVLLPAIKKSLINANNTTQEYIHLLSTIVGVLPDEFPDLNKLKSTTDIEVDFFSNITHIQLHRRAKALKRFQKLAVRHRFEPPTLLKVLFPLFMSIVMESKFGDKNNLLDDAVKSIGTIAKLLPWNQYLSTLNTITKRITKKPEFEKILVKLICHYLDNFHFKLKFRGKDQSLQDEIYDQSEKIMQSLLDTVVPELYKHISGQKKTEAVRVSVALAIVKILKLLPADVMQFRLPSLITKICQSLQSRDQIVRDITRDTLISVSVSLGSKYFHFIVQELRSALQRGYQVHVLGYTIWALLDGMAKRKPKINVGSIDDCTIPIFEILMHDLTGQVAEQREVAQIAASMTEAKGSKAYQAFEILGKFLSFPSAIGQLIDELGAILARTARSELVEKISEILKRVCFGLTFNKSVTDKDLLIFAYKRIQNHLELKGKDEAPKEVTKAPKKITQRNMADSLLLKPDPKSVVVVKHFVRTNQHHIAEFAQLAIYTAITRENFNMKNELHVSMLDPFVKLLLNAAKSSHTNVVIWSLKILSLLAKLPLPSLRRYMNKIVRMLFQKLDEGEIEDQISGACLKLLTVLIKHCSYSNINNHQLQALVQLIGNNIDDNSKQHVSFSLLKAVLNKKLLIPEIYDLMIKIARVMIRSDSRNIRIQTSHLFMQFLLYYPLGEKRLHQHLTFLVNNLGYAYDSGRQSVLEILNTLFFKFPKEIMDQYAEFFFLPLLVRLANEESASCRRLVAEVLKSLFRSLETPKVEKMFSLTLGWYEGNQNGKSEETESVQAPRQLIRAAAQAIGIFFETMGKLLASKEDVFIEIMSRHLKREVETEQREDGSVDPSWEVCYFSLTSLEKLTSFVVSPKFLHSTQVNEGIWPSVLKLLLHPHSWVRVVSSRLIGLYFSSAGKASMKEEFLFQHDNFFELTKKLCSRTISDALSDQTVKNLVYIGMAFVNHADLDQYEGKAENSNGQTNEDENVEVAVNEEGETEITVVKSNLQWLFKRMERLSKLGGEKQKLAVFKWIAAMNLQMSVEAFQPFLLVVLTMIFKAESSGEGQLHKMAENVAEVLQKKIGVTAYFEAYNKVRGSVKEARQAKKRKLAVEAAVNPRLSKLRKQHKREKRKESLKRTIDVYKETRRTKVLKLDKSLDKL